MSGSNPATIPAHISAEDLAKAIGRSTEEVLAALKEREEPSAPLDYVDADVAVKVAKSLGSEIQVESRDLALEYLYEFETRGESAAPSEGRVAELFDGVVNNLENLDARIEKASQHWSVSRMPAVDRNILRLGLYELEHHEGTSTAVIVSESVRLAQTYSTEKSSSFVNGVLSALASDIKGR